MHCKPARSITKYDFVNWDTRSKFVDKLLESSMEEFKAFIMECHLVATSSALDIADALSRLMASAVKM